ncbi:MAG: putative selenium-dependent hydroxylase accessory protein YqeC, partial [Psychrilyobacter sp.]|nr:putative selenium-dependent hydroxylase accessory protein YqeC [Psychrilyobacter sp.]
MIDIIKKGEIISITGAGGKTSLIFFLAKTLSKKGRVLITTTTKIYIPEKQYFEKLYIGNSVVMGDSKNIVVEGRGTLENKLLGLTYDEIEDRKKLYDYILIEADGSKRKLLKGWNDSEPCIPNFTTLTIGVVNLKSIGLTINKENIHRLKIFQKNTSEAVGKLITSDILIKYIETGSFFQKINSKNIIF